MTTAAVVGVGAIGSVFAAALQEAVIIRWSDEDKTATIWTAQRPMITKLKKNLAASLVNEREHEGSVWAEFEMPPR